jgi:phage protein D/phage baseplate assembly protein gpV
VADDRRIDTPVLTVDGQPLASDLYPRLRQLRVEESVHLPDRFTIRFDDPVFELFDAGTITLGSRVQVAFRTEAEPMVVTEGEVTSLAVEPGSSGHHELVAVGLDRGHRLARQPRTRTFQNMSDAAIARQLAGEYSLDTDLRLSGETLDYVMQAAQTDWAFLRERAARSGYDVWVTGNTLHVAPTPTGEGTPPTLRWKENLHHFSVRFAAADRCDEVVVHGWDGPAKRAVQGSARDGDPGSDAPAVTRLADRARSSFGRERRESGRRGIRTPAEADALAQSLLARTSGSEVVLRGEATGDPRLGAGASVRVEGVGAGLTGTYRLTSVEHLFTSGTPYVTRFVSGTKDPAGLVDLLSAGANGRAPGSSELGAVLGLVIGEVTNNADPDDLGRVRVRFPTLSTQDESFWARVAAPGAGRQRGIQWLPEVGDEVLAGFEFGDVHRPVILGGLWNRTDPPVEPKATEGGKVTTRVLASRNDHRLELVDESVGRVTLRLGDARCEVTLTKDETRVVGERKVSVSGENIEVTADQKLVLKAAQIEIAASRDVTVSGSKIKLN